MQIIDNPKAERVRRVASLTSHNARERSGRFLIEGPQSVREAVRWRADAVQDLYVAESASPAVRSIEEESQRADSPIYVHHVTDAVLERMSGDAQGIVAVGSIEAMQTRSEELELTGAKATPAPALIAAFWQVRDPGNAGTVIRAADAAGCAAVMLVDDCVDRFNPKTVRSTAGSLFHIPVLAIGTDDFFAFAAERSMPVWAADVYGTPSRRPEPLPDVLAADRSTGAGTGTGARGPRAVLFGNEARGLEQSELNRCERIVSIPIYGKAESLNLGTSAAVMLMSMAMSSHAGTILAV